MDVALIACGKRKLPHAAPARTLYAGTLFRLSWWYAPVREPDFIHILSAEHGLLHPATVLEPYDDTLNGEPASERRVWAQGVVRQLEANHDLHQCHFLVLAGMAYRRYLVDHFASWEAPLAGLGIGQQLAFLKRALA